MFYIECILPKAVRLGSLMTSEYPSEIVSKECVIQILPWRICETSVMCTVCWVFFFLFFLFNFFLLCLDYELDRQGTVLYSN